MIHRTRNALLAVFALLMTIVQSGVVDADEAFPVHPIKIICAFDAGSISASLLRVFAESLGARLNQPVVVEAMPGAGGVSAASAALSAPHDGHTLILFSTATSIAPSQIKNLPYDPVNDFVPISTFATFANVLAGPSAGPGTLKDFLADARKNPGTLNIGTPTAGSAPHLAAMLFKFETNINVVIVPYKTFGELTKDVVRGEVHLGVLPFSNVKGLAQAGTVRILADLSDHRAVLPDVPTAREQGVPVTVVTWSGLFAPRGTPTETVRRLTEATRSVLEDPVIAERFRDLDAHAGASSPETLGNLMTSEIKRWHAVMEKAGIAAQ